MADGHPKPTIRWLKDGKPLEEARRPNGFRPFQTRDEKWEMRIPGLTKADEGNYTCIVSNPSGVKMKTFTVEALRYLTHEPILVDQSENITVLEGMKAHLTCVFQSDLGVMVYWLRPAVGFRGPDMNKINASDPSHFEKVTSANGDTIIGETLTIANARPEDGGLYFCVGQTNVAAETSSVHLSVLREYEAILERPRNLTVEVGESAIFTCRSHSALRDHTSWVQLLDDDIVILDDGTEVLHIENATHEDSGLYACVVGTDVAYIQAVAALEVVEPDTTAIPTSTMDQSHLKVE